jgi:phosphoribosylanthranilate isomerase
MREYKPNKYISLNCVKTALQARDLYEYYDNLSLSKTRQREYDLKIGVAITPESFYFNNVKSSTRLTLNREIHDIFGCIPDKYLSIHLCNVERDRLSNMIWDVREEFNDSVFLQLNVDYDVLFLKSGECNNCIIQFDPTNKDSQYHNYLHMTKRFNHILIDSSHGKGIKSLTIGDVRSRVIYDNSYLRLGYAGGLDPENVYDFIRENPDLSLDVESGIRTNNELDLAKCHKFLEEVMIR